MNKSLGGKSGTGRKEKHHYYGHAQIKNPFQKEKPQDCQVKNVRAPRLEEIVTRSLKSLLSDPSLIEKWVEIYKSKTSTELPDVQGQTKKMDQEIQTTSKRIANLVQRISELPAEVPAEAFFDQIKQMTAKLNDLKLKKPIHPMKIKIGMYAPSKEQYKATGTDGTPSPETKTQNLNEKEGKLLPFSPTQRVGSSTDGIGARDWT